MRVALLVVVFVTACSSAGHSIATSSPSPGGYLGSLGSSACRTAPAFHPWNGGPPEVGFDTAKGSFWALFFNPVPPPAGQEIKVVWKMTGTGEFTFRVTDSNGKTIPLAWGPDAHGSSNWGHPGDEVGTGLNFPHPGCWVIHVARQDARGDLWLEVSSR